MKREVRLGRIKEAARLVLELATEKRAQAAAARVEAAADREAHALHHLEIERGPLGPWRRQALIHHVRVLADRYGLEAEVAGHLARADRADLTGLSTDQLVGVLASITKTGSAIETACDWPDRPPAR